VDTPVEQTGDKLVWDAKAGRFYERNLEQVCEEEFCLLDAESGAQILLTREEKERIFLDCIQGYYFSGKGSLPDDQFDRLREDLSWEGSALVTLNRNETMFMNAMMAYNKGTPILSDKEFDELKASLRESKSKIAVAVEPKCFVDTGVCKVTWVEDQVRTNSLKIPALLLLTTAYLGIIYEIPGIRDFNPLFTLAIGSLPISTAAKEITEKFFFKDPFVASGPCPSCGVENRIFFGDVLGVVGDKSESSLKCVNCKAGLTIKRNSLRVSTLAPKKGPPAAAAAEED